MTNETIPLRKDVPEEYKWDLTQLYKNEEEWKKDLAQIPSLVEKLVSFKNRLGENKETLLASLKASCELDMKIEKVFHWASLCNEQDQSDSKAQENYNEVLMAYSKAEAETAFYTPELLSIPDEKINEWIEDKSFDDYRVSIKKTLHAKPHILRSSPRMK